MKNGSESNGWSSLPGSGGAARGHREITRRRIGKRSSFDFLNEKPVYLCGGGWAECKTNELIGTQD
jgi:hypothetical protein